MSSSLHDEFESHVDPSQNYDSWIDATDEKPYPNNFNIEETIRTQLNNQQTNAVFLENGKLYKHVLYQLERPLLEMVLKNCSGNQCKAARVLGINRNTLRKKIDVLGLKNNRFK